ncbi:MAG TPA: glycosyltransferase [Phnomibacter sp.]|nr:glycosyltransferase [Phnomibacter sp.]
MKVVLDAAYFVFIGIQLVALVYFILPTILFLLNALKKKKGPILASKSTGRLSYAAIITAHRDLRFIPPFIDSLQKQEYKNFVAYVVADDCDTSDIIHLQNENIVVLRPSPALHSKTSSIKYAIDNFVEQHDVLIIFDADNLLHPQYFQNLNNYFEVGYEAVQTHMLSKNIDSDMARVDSIGHIYNTFLERDVKMNLGLHSAILGLGIAVKTEIYKKLLYNTSLGGFDKILQCYLAKNTRQIAFASDAIVYDEKIESGPAMEKQRTRWLFTYFKYLPLGWNLLLNGISRFKPGTALLGLSMVRPPLFLLMLFAFVFLLIDFFVVMPMAITWLITLAVFAITYVLIIMTASKQSGMTKALIHVPSMVFWQISALLKLKKARKDFLQTEHEHIIFIDEILVRDKVKI